MMIVKENYAGTVHSKCSSTGSACPVASGHRDSIQQEMLKERLSDLLGEPCLFASACQIDIFNIQLFLYLNILRLLTWKRFSVAATPGFSSPSMAEVSGQGLVTSTAMVKSPLADLIV